jgi:hypothetical protein
MSNQSDIGISNQLLMASFFDLSPSEKADKTIGEGCPWVDAVAPPTPYIVMS